MQSDHDKRVAELEAEVERLRKDRKACWEELKALVKSSNDNERYLHEEIDRLNKEADENTAEWGAVRLELAEAKAENERLREEVERLTKANEEKWVAFCSLNAKYDAAFAELTVIRAMCTSIENREWADHFATGETSSRVEAAFSQLFNDWSALKADAEEAIRLIREAWRLLPGEDTISHSVWHLAASEFLNAARTAKPEVDHE
nr:hypothetical protein [Pseudomonas luteola]